MLKRSWSLCNAVAEPVDCYSGSTCRTKSGDCDLASGLRGLGYLAFLASTSRWNGPGHCVSVLAVTAGNTPVTKRIPPRPSVSGKLVGKLRIISKMGYKKHEKWYLKFLPR